MLTADSGQPSRRHPRLYWDTLLVALVAYVPLLLSRRGLLVDDTKIYLYLDPSHLLATAASMWNPTVAFGTVTHQNIGYLLPMGPFFWLVKAVGIPMWIGQRIWLGSLLLLAFVGVRRCAQELGLSRRAGGLGAWAYMLTPYILVNIDRTSALIMPWAGLGWMMLFTIRAARRNDWRNPALFALVVALVGGVNATSILMVGVAPILFLLAGAFNREFPWRRCFAVMVRIGVLSLVVSVWWIAGLWAEGKYGINILRFTETLDTVTYTSTASEIFRGLGYWYFYGRDSLQNWTLAALGYMAGKVVPTASFLVPAVGFVGALVIRWRYRLWLAATMFVGMVLAVGAYPYGQPTPIGKAFKYLALHTTAALAMRSSNRVVPVIVLVLALGAAAGYDAWRKRAPKLSLYGATAYVVVVAVAMLPLFQLKAISTNLTLPSTLPSYVTQAANALNHGSSNSNVLGLPGEDFAYYRFGASEDSIWPGLLTRGWISSQVQLEGEAPSIVMVRGLDSTLQNGIAVPSAIAPIARLLNAGDLLIQMDLQYERYNSPLPSYMWGLLSPTPKGLRLKGLYGPRGNFQAVNGPFINEAILGLKFGYKFPHQLAIFVVSHPRTLVRTEDASAPMIVAGDGEGLVTLGELGLLNNSRTILFDGSLSAKQLQREADKPGAWLVLTDSNQRRLDTYGTLQATQGYVLTSNETPPGGNVGEETLPEFTNSRPGSQTVALLRGLKSVEASGYGNIITNNPEDQPFEAVDGSLDTAWEVASFSPAVGQYWEETALAPHVISSLHFVQPQSITQNRSITEIRITIDGTKRFTRWLTKKSTLPTGQTVTIPPTRGSTIKITILGDTDNDEKLANASAVGFAEVTVNGFGPATRGLLLPKSLLRDAGPATALDRLTVVVNRLRAATTPPRLDPEYGLLRYFYLPSARTFTVRGLTNLNPAIDDDQLNYLVGRHPGAGVSIEAAESSSRITGSATDSAWAAFDGNPNTAWESRFHVGKGEWLKTTLSAPITLSNFSISVVNDGYHMIPTQMSVSNGTSTESFALPITLAKPDGTLNTTQTIPVSVPPMTGSRFTFTITQIKTVQILDRVTGGANFPSFAISDISLPGVNPGVTPTTLPRNCHANLLYIDGTAVPVSITGSTANALAQNQLSFTTCHAGATITLSAGLHSIRSAWGLDTGWNINNVVLNSPGVNVAAPATITSKPAHWQGLTVVHSTVTPADDGRWLVLAQSYAQGWHATVGGVDLGTPTLVDGASMGWRLPEHLTGTEQVTFNWQPQNLIRDALLFSALALAAVLAIAIFDRPRRRRLLDEVPTEMEPTWAGTMWAALCRPVWLYGTAIVAGAAISVYAIPAFVIVVFLWRRFGGLGRLVALAAAALVAAGAAFTIRATLSNTPRDISWPTKVPYANSLVWLAICLWVIYLVGTSVRFTSTGRPSPASPPPRLGRRERREHFDPLAALAPPTTTPAEPIAERRRGLNVPVARDVSLEGGVREVPPIPPGGLARSRFLWRARKTRHNDPVAWNAMLTQDSINQAIGRAPIFNRRVLEVTNGADAHAAGLIERGAHVTLMRPEGSAPSSAPVRTLFFSPTELPAPDETFDLVFAINVFTADIDAAPLLDELVRVTRRGGSLYIENVNWRGLIGRVENRQLRELVRERPDLGVFVEAPRFLPHAWMWMLRVPGLRPLLMADFVVVAERL